MARRRLSLALLVPPPVSHEVDGLRRALGDPALGSVAPHLTLVPPVNVREDDLDEGLAMLRGHLSRCSPFELELGPAETFEPVNPVVYLAVRCPETVAVITEVRDQVFRPPFDRELTHPFVPHVTLAESASPSRIDAALEALADFCATVVVDGVHVMQECPRDVGRVWEPIADLSFRSPAIVGRGGIELELTVSELVPPDARRLEEAEWPDRELASPREPSETGLVVVARSRGIVVGLSTGLTEGPMARLHRVVVSPDARHQGIAGHLLGTFEYEAVSRGANWLVGDLLDLTPMAALLERRGWVRGGAVAGRGLPMVEYRRLL